MTQTCTTADATLALLGMRSPLTPAGCGEAPGCEGALALEGVSWQKLIAFASGHFVLQALAEPLKQARGKGEAPDDLQNFMDGFRKANRARNAQLYAALTELATALNGCGVTPVALKGATFLLDDPAGHASWRFMSDLDLLVPETRLMDCVAALQDLGYSRATDNYDPSEEAHFPPLISPCGTFCVELHTRLFGREDFGLPAASVRADATLVQHGSARLKMPSMRHRLGHLLAHAQLHNRNFATHRIVLKDLLDLRQLAHRQGGAIDTERLLGMFRDGRHRIAVAALLAAWESLRPGASMGRASSAEIQVQAQAQAQAQAKTWAKRALARLAAPRWRAMMRAPLDVLALEWHRMRYEGGHLGRRLRLFKEPARLVPTTQRWAGKMQQRLWG